MTVLHERIARRGAVAAPHRQDRELAREAHEALDDAGRAAERGPRRSDLGPASRARPVPCRRTRGGGSSRPRGARPRPRRARARRTSRRPRTAPSGSRAARTASSRRAGPATPRAPRAAGTPERAPPASAPPPPGRSRTRTSRRRRARRAPRAPAGRRQAPRGGRRDPRAPRAPHRGRRSRGRADTRRAPACVRAGPRRESRCSPALPRSGRRAPVAVCVARKARSASRISGRFAPRIAAASSAAFTAPALPIASVPTGTPAGICTMESSESTPFSAADSTGTPSTGSTVLAAAMPGRCAAPPAPAISTSRPRASALPAYSKSRSGVRCAETTRTSCGTPSCSSVSAA